MTRLMMIFASLLITTTSIGIQSACAAPATPHPDQPVLRGEHMLFLDLIRETDVTHRAVHDGKWSDPATWEHGLVPTPGATVLIPHGVNVTLGHIFQPAMKDVRVDGRLQFASDRNTGLILDTLIIAPGGQLVIGTPQQPIAANRSARITFTDTGPIDTTRDPAQLGRGLISHGTVSIHGSSVTPFVALTHFAKVGDTKLQLANTPAGWKPGDRLVLPGTALGSNQDEQLTIISTSGAEVTVQPLAFDHAAPVADLPVYLANVTRNVVLASQTAPRPGASDRAGHVMFMHSANVDISCASFENLGRTDKSRIIEDPRLDDQGHLIAGTGHNPRGRYAIHFHRTGIDRDAPPARVTGSVVLNTPGWGFVNHSSNVLFEDNISANAFGSGFVTEAGDEIGTFRHNLAIRSQGSGEGEDVRKKVQDFAHEGDGFWFQGPGIAVENNIACGQAASGFIYFTEGLIQGGLGTTRFPVANLADATWAGKIDVVDHKDPDKVSDPASVPVIAVPIRGFKGNTAYACNAGFTVRFHRGSPAAGESVIQDSVAWNTVYGAKVRYTSNLVLRNLRLEGGFDKNALFGIAGTLEGVQDIRYENLRIQGWACGIHVPEAGHHTITGGYWNNVKSILVPTPYSRGRQVEIAGDIRFGVAEPAALHTQAQYDIYMDAEFTPLLNSDYRDPNVLFVQDRTLLRFGSYSDRQLYYPEQKDSYVPFATAAAANSADRKRFGQPGETLPPDLIGKTNSQLYKEFGLAIGGAVAPADQVSVPRIHGLIGSPAAYPVERIPYPSHAASLHGFTPAFVRVEENGKKSVKSTTHTEPVDLHAGWNLLTQRIDGELASFLIFGGEGQKAVMKAGKY
jgi:hypothetical protein